MQRRALLKALLQGLGIAAGGSTVAGAATALPQQRKTLLLQESPLAGFAYYDGAFALRSLAVGDPLQLRREAGNRYDRQAVEVWYGPAKLGYVPRRDNAAIAQLLDRGELLQAWVTQVDAVTADVWQKLRFSVCVQV